MRLTLHEVLEYFDEKINEKRLFIDESGWWVFIIPFRKF